MKIFAKVQYLGTFYKGWQKQINEPSIQEEIEKVLSKILNTEINIYGSGRTDAGVHAYGQTFHFNVDKEVDLSRLKYSINMLLPKDIFVKELKEVGESFHARFLAKEKTYQYQIYFGDRDPFLNGRALHYPYEFDLDLFKEALGKFIGTHNYQDFTSKEEDEEGFVRTISSIDVFKEGKLLKINISGNGFMRYMIRNIIGTALAVSNKKENISFISSHLDKKERNIVSYKADACGLYLLEVKY